MNTKRLEQYLTEYPKLANFIDAGLVTLKMARTILEIDRHTMSDMFYDMVEHGIVKPAGTNSWRATPALVKYMTKKRDFWTGGTHEV